jgi:hypothetical protein
MRITFDFTAKGKGNERKQELRTERRPHGCSGETKIGGTYMYAGVPSVPTFDGTPAPVSHFATPPMLEPNF